MTLFIQDRNGEDLVEYISLKSVFFFDILHSCGFRHKCNMYHIMNLIDPIIYVSHLSTSGCLLADAASFDVVGF